MTLLVVAHPHDEAAARLVQRWRPQGARLLAPRDLSRPGWRFYVGGRGEGWCVAEGERVRTADVAGVLTRLPNLDGALLPHLHEGDRFYSAAEMTAFLIAWLTHLRCPVLNRPSAASVMGPGISGARWQALASRAGFPLPARRDDGRADLPVGYRTATVIGERCLGDAAPAVHAQALVLARLAGAQVLTVQVGGDRERAPFLAAELVADVDEPEIADALLECVLRGRST